MQKHTHDFGDLAGLEIDGRFRLVKRLGMGAAGAVYEAWQTDLHRTVALKVLSVDRLSDQDARSRFEREAILLARIRSPHVVQFLSWGIWRDAHPYIVMEYLSGCTLGSVLTENGGSISWRLAFTYGLQMCEGLQAIHSLGSVHRDLTPRNIMVCGNQIKIIDLGLTSVANGQKLTQTGLLLGTPYYFSPELCAGRRTTAQSDIYALGCILYEMISGAKALEGDTTMGLIYKHTNVMPDPILNVPDCVSKVVFKCLQKRESDRYQSVSAVREDLVLALHDSKSEDVSCSSGRSILTSPIGLSVLSMLALIFLPLSVLVVKDLTQLNAQEQVTCAKKLALIKGKISLQTADLRSVLLCHLEQYPRLRPSEKIQFVNQVIPLEKRLSFYDHDLRSLIFQLSGKRNSEGDLANAELLLLPLLAKSTASEDKAPTDFDIMNVLIEACFQQHRNEEAKRWCLKQLNHIMERWTAEQFEICIRNIGRCQDLGINSKEQLRQIYLSKWPETVSDATLSRMRTIAITGCDVSEARTLLRKVLDVSIKNGSALETFKAACILGRKSHEFGDEAEAKRLLTQAITAQSRVSPRDAHAGDFEDLAYLCVVCGRKRDAMQFFEKSLRAPESNLAVIVSSHVGLADALIADRNLPLARVHVLGCF